VGWALKSDDDIPKGTFLGIYAGKVFRLKETGEEVEGQGEDEEELNEEDLGLEFIYELDGTLKRTEDGRLEEGQWAQYMIDSREQGSSLSFACLLACSACIVTEIRRLSPIELSC
jgi:hypothetical protein